MCRSTLAGKNEACWHQLPLAALLLLFCSFSPSSADTACSLHVFWLGGTTLPSEAMVSHNITNFCEGQAAAPRVQSHMQKGTQNLGQDSN